MIKTAFKTDFADITDLFWKSLMMESKDLISTQTTKSEYIWLKIIVSFGKYWGNNCFDLTVSYLIIGCVFITKIFLISL